MVLRIKKCDKIEIKLGINQEKVPLFHLDELVLFLLLLCSKNNIRSSSCWNKVAFYSQSIPLYVFVLGIIPQNILRFVAKFLLNTDLCCYTFI